MGVGSGISQGIQRRARANWLYPVLIVAINLIVAHKLFAVSYTAYLKSNEGSFIALSRHIAEGGWGLGWWPLWDNGVPFQNTYIPGLPLLVGAIVKLTGGDVSIVYHRVTATIFMLAPLTVYLMALKLTKQVHASALAAIVFSLFSPGNFVLPGVLSDVIDPRALRRLQILAFYGEGPYTAAIATLPLAILTLMSALNNPRYWRCVLAGALCGIAVLFNAFSAVLLVTVTVSLLASVETNRFLRNALILSTIGIAAYIWISPLLPPSVIHAIRVNSPTVDGDYRFTTRSAKGLVFLVGIFGVVWFLTRRLQPFLRFFCLLATILATIVLLGERRHIYLVPQPHRYQTAMDMTICIVAVFLGTEIVRRLSRKLQIVTIAIAILLVFSQIVTLFPYGRYVVQTADVRQSVDYRIASWADEHMHGRRMLVSGAHSFNFNVFTRTPQFHGGHDPMQPNEVMKIALYTIFQGPRENDGATSILWLKAMGVHAVSVPGPDSDEFYKPFVNPQKFDGLLPVLWKEGGNTIYQVPARSDSLAHVVPYDTLVNKQPINGLDTSELQEYVNALDDPTLPPAPLEWKDWSHGAITTTVDPGHALSIQMTYHPGWHATIEGREQPTEKDGLGLLIIRPDCASGCQIELNYDGGFEGKATRYCSITLMAGIAAFGLLRRSRLAREPN